MGTVRGTRSPALRTGLNKAAPSGRTTAHGPMPDRGRFVSAAVRAVRHGVMIVRASASPALRTGLNKAAPSGRTTARSPMLDRGRFVSEVVRAVRHGVMIVRASAIPGPADRAEQGRPFRADDGARPDVGSRSLCFRRSPCRSAWGDDRPGVRDPRSFGPGSTRPPLQGGRRRAARCRIAVGFFRRGPCRSAWGDDRPGVRDPRSFGPGRTRPPLQGGRRHAARCRIAVGLFPPWSVPFGLKGRSYSGRASGPVDATPPRKHPPTQRIL